MSNFFSEQGRTRVYAETYFSYVAGAKPAENAAQRKKGHFWMATSYRYGKILMVKKMTFQA
ncbi:MAG: hypothetical protein BBJ60_12660 [Desulfobacterales bacterium S7086C20]|nr:MAG: hypothetical protein BBJ60_12660 [Desulfobacterales bacterium S7086C20]